MAKQPTFVPYTDGRICTRCGSLLGRLGDREGLCPAPSCSEDGRLLPGVDPSWLYRGRALVFVPDESQRAPEGDGRVEDVKEQTGVVIAVSSEQVTSKVARRHAPVVVTGFSWPRDRKHFGELFDHHIHHVNGPLVTPLNDGWDADHPLPVL